MGAFNSRSWQCQRSAQGILALAAFFASKPFEDAAPKGKRSSIASFAANFLPSLAHPGAEKEQPRKSGKMLALTFDNDPKMQDYLTKSYTIAHRQVQASDIEEGLTEISF